MLNNYVYRLACSTIERGYAPSEAREIRAMASFHNPNGFLYGYIRLVCTQIFAIIICAILLFIIKF